MHFERIYFVVHRKENILVNQAIAKRTAHPPSFETGQMCSFICIPLIFKWLKKRVHPEVNSLKRLSSACCEGEHPLLLRKECGNAGETRLLPKECRADLRRKWFSGACCEGERPLLLRKEWGNAGETRLLPKECRIEKECRIDFRRKWL